MYRANATDKDGNSEIEEIEEYTRDKDGQDKGMSKETPESEKTKEVPENKARGGEGLIGGGYQERAGDWIRPKTAEDEQEMYMGGDQTKRGRQKTRAKSSTRRETSNKLMPEESSDRRGGGSTGNQRARSEGGKVSKKASATKEETRTNEM